MARTVIKITAQDGGYEKGGQLYSGPITSNKTPGLRTPLGSLLLPYFCFTAIDRRRSMFNRLLSLHLLHIRGVPLPEFIVPEYGLGESEPFVFV